LRLIAGIIVPTAGNVYLNNTDLRGVNLNYYRSNIGQSMTEETPFEGSLRDNITFGDKLIPEDQVYWALEKVGLLEFLKQLPGGLDTLIYPEGKQISFTVGKKIVLARSIIRKPKMLILKNPLDQFEPLESDRIIEFLTDPSNGWSLVVVSQSDKWLNRCGRIVTLENGRIITDKSI
jgi:ABC-type bacteriocin/lantibiotic exporter with double-glycine peptidase domain